MSNLRPRPCPRSLPGALCLCIALLSAPRLDANEGNYRHYILGDRAAGMGGAACAIANSVEAVYYNPAGLTRAPTHTLSISGNAYGLQSYKAEDGLFPGEDLEADSVVSIPTTAGSVLKPERGPPVGVAVLVPQKRSFADVQAFTDRDHYYNFGEEDETLWAGPAAAWQISGDVSMGASLFAVYRSYSSLRNFYWGDLARSFTQNIEAEHTGILATLGAQCRLPSNWRLGLAFQTESLSLQGSGEFQRNLLVGREAFSGAASRYCDDMDVEDRVPARITAGIAREEPRAYAFALDVTHHFPADYDLLDGRTDTGERFTLSRKREAVTDVSVGGEYYLAGKYPVRAGFFTSLSSAPDPRPESREEAARVDLYGITANIGAESQHVAANIGVVCVWGDGEGYGWGIEDGALAPTVVDVSERHTYLTLSTSYSF